MKLIIVAAMAIATVVLVAPSASADTITGQGGVAQTRYHGGNPSLGGISFNTGVQVNHDPAGNVTMVRGSARITKTSKAVRIQVDRIALGTATGTAAVSPAPVNSGAAQTVVSYTPWKAVTPGTCIEYRVRTNYGVRWTDGLASAISILTPLTQVCAPAMSRRYQNCAEMNQTFPHGVGRPGAVDSTSGTPVTDFYVSAYIYNGSSSTLDRDKDGIDCEKP